MTPQAIIYINMITFESYLDSIRTYIDKITISGKNRTKTIMESSIKYV